MDIGHAAEHVRDAIFFHLPQLLGGKYRIPSIPLPGGREFQPTKFMVLELVAGLLMLLIFIPMARRVARGTPVRGRFWNLFETMLVFLRDEVARPAIGRHDADRFLPFIWNAFFFILFCNLLGILPWAGSPTGSLSVTGALAGIAFLVVVGAGMARYGAVKFWTGMVPHMDLPGPLRIFLIPMMLVIEVVGLFIRHAVLAVRLLANMFAGHLVLAVIVGFIPAAAESLSLFVAWAGIAAASVLGAAALNLLELFVAFLQAYIFAFLSALFIGMAVHQH